MLCTPTQSRNVATISLRPAKPLDAKIVQGSDVNFDQTRHGKWELGHDVVSC